MYIHIFQYVYKYIYIYICIYLYKYTYKHTDKNDLQQATIHAVMVHAGTQKHDSCLTGMILGTHIRNIVVARNECT